MTEKSNLDESKLIERIRLGYRETKDLIAGINSCISQDLSTLQDYIKLMENNPACRVGKVAYTLTHPLQFTEFYGILLNYLRDHKVEEQNHEVKNQNDIQNFTGI